MEASQIVNAFRFGRGLYEGSGYLENDNGKDGNDRGCHDHFKKGKGFFLQKTKTEAP